MLGHKDLLIKIKFLSISIFSLLLVKLLLRFISLGSMIKKIKRISRFFFSLSKSKISIEKIHLWYLRLNKTLNIKSCFINSLAQKIIFSFYGYDFLVVCGIKFDGSNFSGHAWLSYKNEIIFEEKENIDSYIESFKI